MVAGGVAGVILDAATGRQPAGGVADAGLVLAGPAGGTRGGAVDHASSAACAVVDRERGGFNSRMRDSHRHRQYVWRVERDSAAWRGLRSYLSSGGREDREPFSLLPPGVL